MKIAVDIDNVLSNFNEMLLKAFLKHDKKLRNKGIINKNADYITRGMFDWTKEETDDFYKNNIEDIVKNLDVIDGAKECIDKLREEGYKIYIVTGRDNGEYKDSKSMTEVWLKENNINYDKLIFTNAYEVRFKEKLP